MKQIDLSTYSVNEINNSELLIINEGSEATEAWTYAIGAALHHLWNTLSKFDAQFILAKLFKVCLIRF